MDSLVIVIFTYLILVKCYIVCQEDSSYFSPAIVETQYLTFDMTQYGPNGGVFSSPNFPNHYPQDTILFYQFIAASDYRVLIEIDHFQVRGVIPQCTHDYLDVFINVTDFNLVYNIVNDQLLHRYCGRTKPPLLISYTNLLLLGFFTEDTQTEKGFNGTFRFISGQPYKNHLVREPCDYIFNSSMSKRGEFLSSTYPGTYLPWQSCNYSFVGLPGERIHIRFRDLVLFKRPNQQHCPVDLIKLYDNTLNPVELQRFLSNFYQTNSFNYQTLPQQTDQHHITDLCGKYTMPLDVYSTSNRLLLYFITTHYGELTDGEQEQFNDRSISLWRKGFYGEYEFFTTLTKLDFISRNRSNQYLLGTECDQTIKSFGQGHGEIQSPNWPNLYKPQTSCTTYLLGLDDRYVLENVEIEFDHFDIDCHLASFVIYNASRIYDYHSRTHSSSVLRSEALITAQKSSSFSNYYQQELDFKDNLSFCGHFKPEGRFVSRSALLKLSLIPIDRLSEKTLPLLNQGGKFQVKYKFVKSYHQVFADEYDRTNSSICNLHYYQSRTNAGKFEPPRSSENDYFSNSNCTFNFYLLNEYSRLLIWYDYFNIADNNYNQCSLDNVTYSYRSYISSTYYSYPYIYCGYRNFPPPYLTSRLTEQYRIHFRSNDDTEAGLGFYGRYEFLNESNILFSSVCRSPFDSIIHINETEQPSGNLSSNGYPENVICEWSYATTNGFQFNLELTMLDLEGSKTKDPPQGCQSSVLRIYSEGKIEELCGQEKDIYILTNSNWFTLQFISLNRQTQDPLQGFSLSWTIVQVKNTLNNNQCLLSNDYFDCKKFSNNRNETLFCIHRSLICDGNVHCQPLSKDDEYPNNCLENFSPRSHFISWLIKHQNYIFIFIVIILSIVMLCISIILIFLCIRTRRRRQRQEQQEQQHEQECLSDETKTKSTKVSLYNNDDNDDDDNNDRDLSHLSILEETVTTV
ncbi:unnamed protein product [Rotaria socialis]|uniref:CUB domain-containing protein n=1 Tax=Rotaria socialis TaxID=392032 RepID=A0A820T9N8_9BILA|nr:unnamed protein product [Rotaria socialis]CAF4468758.1 unnamed protein product [Rotaria socialis]